MLCYNIYYSVFKREMMALVAQTCVFGGGISRLSSLASVRSPKPDRLLDKRD